MVGPLYIIAIALGTAFSLGFFKKANRNIPYAIMFLAIAFMTFISGQWLYAFLANQQEAIQIFTAGFQPPFSISLQMGLHEAVFVSMINGIGLLSALYLYEQFRDKGVQMMMVFILLFMGLNVIIMTRDIFNLFVFLEISTIAIIGLILLEKKEQAMSSGFKYLIASGIISGILLIGIIAIYYYNGTLFINDIISSNPLLLKGGSVAVFLTLMAIVLELKPFPVNGWALDVYESAHPGVGAILSAATGTAMLFVLYKITPFIADPWFNMIATIGIITFIGSNLLGIQQENAQRLLGYSSVGQLGLIMLVIGLSPYLGDNYLFIGFTLLISHFLAKAGLFWIAGIIKQKKIKNWSVLRKTPLLMVLFGIFILTLLGFPPFPSFFGKWELVMELSNNHQLAWIIAILAGSFLEAVYLFRWFGYALKKEIKETTSKIQFSKILPPFLFGITSLVAGYYTNIFQGDAYAINYLPLALVLIITLIDFISAKIKNSLAILAMAYYGFLTLPGLYENDFIRFIFMAIFIGGGILTLIAGYAYQGKRKGFYPAALLMFSGLGGIIEAQTTLQFFFAWEIMTFGSYLLIIRGKHSIKHGFSYILFSLGGAYLLLMAFGLMNAQVGMQISALSDINTHLNLIFSLLAIGFMTKMASLGLHIWLPGAHAEAESDVSPMVSAILLKAGVFGLLITILAMGAEYAQHSTLLYILGWIGALTALVGNLAASFQEDAKRLLAYSSIGQLGYILFAYAMATHLGWVGGFVYVINHFAFKAVLFLTIGAVVLRVGTHKMYEMGGLIKRMPLAFIAVLIGIITLSGVPPLSGFAGKWFFYHALISKGWYFQGAVVLFAGIIAFLYCFRLIQSIFLGQLKDNHRKVKEISIWFIIPIYTLIIGIMIFSARPHWILQPISEYIAPYFGRELTWNGSTAIAEMGYWNGEWIMYIIGVMFVLILGWLLYTNAKAQKVKQFNIVYSGERPFTPETTHIAHNMYAGYSKALGFIVEPYITRFWNNMSDAIVQLGGLIKRIYNGNGQTYAFYIIAYIVITFFLVF